MNTNSRPPPEHEEHSPAAGFASGPSPVRPPQPDAPRVADRPRRNARTRRVVLLGAAALTIVIGLTVHAFATGPLADPAGDVLYAVMASLFVAFMMPRWSAWLVAVVAFLVCAGIEFFQLTGVPRTLAEHWAPIRLVLGTTFVPTDLLAYAAGAGFVLIVSLGIAVVARWVRENRRERDRSRVASEAREAREAREALRLRDAERRRSTDRRPGE